MIWDTAVPWALSASSVCPVLIIIINNTQCIIWKGRYIPGLLLCVGGRFQQAVKGLTNIFIEFYRLLYSKAVA